MRLTEILNALFESGGGEIYIGETRLDGIVLDKDDGTLVASTIASNLDSSGLRVSIERQNPFVGSSTRLVATANVDFDTYEWSNEGSATFLSGITTGSTVYLTDSAESSNIVTLTATLNGESRQVQVPINFTTGFFSKLNVVGPSIIDDSDPVRYILDYDPTPDSVLWDITGGGALSNTGMSEAYVTADESGADITITVTASKTGYIDEVAEFAIAVDKCVLSGGSATVERPAIIYPENWEIDDQGTVRTSPFHGLNNPSTIEYQICEQGDGFINILVENAVSYAEYFSVDMSSLIDNSSYDIRIKHVDDLGNKSLWSDIVMFLVVGEEQKIDTRAIKDLFGDSSGVLLAPLNGDASDIDGATSTVPTDITYGTYGGVNPSYAYFNGSTSQIIVKDVGVKAGVTYSFWMRYHGKIFDDYAFLSNASQSWPYLHCEYNTTYNHKVYVSSSDCPNPDVGAPLDTFNHFALSVGESTVRLFINGVLVTQGAPINTLPASFNGEDIALGRDLCCTDERRWTNADFSQFRIFSREITDSEAKILYDEIKFSDSYSDTSAPSHYWAMNTQNPVDEVGDANIDTYFAELLPGGTYDNYLKFTSSTPAYGIAGPAYYDMSDGLSIVARANILSRTGSWTRIIDFGNSDEDGNIVVAYESRDTEYEMYIGFWEVGGGAHGGCFFDVPYVYGEWFTLSAVYTRFLGIRLWFNGIEIPPKEISLDAGVDFSGVRNVGYVAKSHWPDAPSDILIEELAIFEKPISEADIIDFNAKTERPFGGESKYALPCAAVDKPVLLNSEGSRIHLTKYFGERPFAYCEYQVFQDYDITYDTPVFEALTQQEEIVDIDKSIAKDTYKVRTRYYDIDSNKSQWSRPVIFNIYFIPNATIEFLLTDNKDYIGLTNVSQVGVPVVDMGYCQFGSADYFSFDRITFNSGTISFWVKFDDLAVDNGGLHTMIMGGDDTDNRSYIWYNVSNSQIRITDAAEGKILYSNTFTANTTDWYNIIITMDSLESKIYIDMMDIGTGSVGDVLIDNLGTAYAGSTYDFIGGIKGFRKFDSVLTHDERLAVFQEYD